GRRGAPSPGRWRPRRPLHCQRLPAGPRPRRRRDARPSRARAGARSVSSRYRPDPALSPDDARDLAADRAPRPTPAPVRRTAWRLRPGHGPVLVSRRAPWWGPPSGSPRSLPAPEPHSARPAPTPRSVLTAPTPRSAPPGPTPHSAPPTPTPPSPREAPIRVPLP